MSGHDPEFPGYTRRVLIAVSIVVATPPAVAVVELVQMLHVEDVQGDQVEVVGERHRGLQTAPAREGWVNAMGTSLNVSPL